MPMKAFIYLLLSLLGFTACKEEMRCEYGTPSVDYSVKGRVTDSNGNPIKGIVVSSTGVTDSATGKGLEAVTAEDGSFVTNQVHEFGIFGKLLFTDADGAENGGEFATKTVDLNALPKSQVTEGDSWYSGQYEVTADVELRKK